MVLVGSLFWSISEEDCPKGSKAIYSIPWTWKNNELGIQNVSSSGVGGAGVIFVHSNASIRDIVILTVECALGQVKAIR